MSLQFYRTSKATFDSHYSIDGFVNVWYDSNFLSHETKNLLQERIMNYIVDFGVHYNLEDDKDVTFREFIEKYNELIYTN